MLTQVVLVGDELGSTGVGRHTDTFQDPGKSEELVDGLVGEGVLARLGGSGAEGAGEEGDVSGFIGSDLGDPLADEGGVSGLLESLVVELGEGTLVEGVLEVLEGKSEVEDWVEKRRGCQFSGAVFMRKASGGGDTHR